MGATHAHALHADADAAHGARAAADAVAVWRRRVANANPVAVRRRRDANANAVAVEMRWQFDLVHLSRWIASRAQVACWRGWGEIQFCASCLEATNSTFEYPEVQPWGKSASDERTA